MFQMTFAVITPAIAATIIWSALLSFLTLKSLDVTLGLRVTPDEEVQGLDTVLHEETVSF